MHLLMLGVTLWEMYSYGEEPWVGLNGTQVISASFTHTLFYYVFIQASQVDASRLNHWSESYRIELHFSYSQCTKIVEI